MGGHLELIGSLSVRISFTKSHGTYIKVRKNTIITAQDLFKGKKKASKAKQN
jgi:hypothetical protein